MPGTPGNYGYCTPSDLNSLLGGFTEGYYGTDIYGTAPVATSAIEADINAAFRTLNEHLEGYPVVRSTPLALEGSVYPQSAVDANAAWAIYRKLKSVHAPEFDEGVPEWIQRFHWHGTQFLDDVRTGRTVFEAFTAIGELGIAVPSAAGTIEGTPGTSTNSTGTFYNNWEGYGGPYIGAMRQTWRIAIDGAGPAGSATFKWSMDDGVSYSNEGVECGTAWTALADGIFVRFSGGDGTAFAVDDYWRFETVPLYVAAYGDPRVGKIRQFVRA